MAITPIPMPLGEWLPDMPALNNPGITEARNVIPAAGAYRPFRSMAPITNALAARCQGAVSMRDAEGVSQTFAGDAGQLYVRNAATWDAVGKAGGYTTASDDRWAFALFGQQVIATNFTDPVQVFTMGTSTAFADLAAGAPHARHMAVVKDFVMLGNCRVGLNAFPNRVHWSGINDSTAWPEPGTAAATQVQSDRQDLPSGGWVQAIVGAVGGTDGAVFMDNAIYRIAYEGPPTIFGFYEVEHAKGAVAPGAVVPVGDLVFYLSGEGFCAFNGAVSAPIGNEKIDRWFMRTADDTQYHRIVGAADPLNKIVMWSFVSKGAASNDTVLIYNWAGQRWSHARMEAEYLFRHLAASYTLDELDSLGHTLATLPFPLDSRAWMGGKLALAGFTPTHQLGPLDGPALAATVETAELTRPGSRIFISGVRPLVDGAPATVTLLRRPSLADTPTATADMPVGADGVAPFRCDTRYARARITVAAGQDWTHLIGAEALVSESGGR